MWGRLNRPLDLGLEFGLPRQTLVTLRFIIVTMSESPLRDQRDGNETDPKQEREYSVRSVQLACKAQLADELRGDGHIRFGWQKWK